MARENYTITLIGKDGKEVTATVGKPWIARLEKVNELTVKQTLLSERRSSLYMQTNDLNRGLAKAEVDGDMAAATDFKKKLEIVEKGMADCNSKAADHLIEQLKTILELPCKVDEIDWTKIDHEEASEAIVFFARGKRQQLETASA